ncbi:MAG TPA: ISNCY family transposase [Candidatus Sulfotelmatobacter sp.]
MSRARNLQVSFADVEFRRQGIFLDPALQTISDFLDQQEEMIEKVRRDLERGLKNPQTGRNGLTPPQVLRSLVLMRVKNWDYRERRERINDGYTLRRFTDFLSQSVPQHHAFNRAFNRLTPETLRTVNEWVVKAAVGLGLEDGQQLRVDTTVVETEIHHPPDNTLLWDTVRVITRLVGHLAQALGRRLKAFHNRTRAARRRTRAIQRLTPTQRHQQQTKIYRQLIALTEPVVARARRVLQQTEKRGGQDLQSQAIIRSLRSQIGRYCELGERVIAQTRRRVLEGEQVPSTQKVYSIFEPHTDLIKRGKVETPLEFGHKVFLAESAQGLITQYVVLSGNPGDQGQVEPSLRRHRETFGHAPHLYGSDRGFHSPNNLQACRRSGVKVVCIPQRGGKKTSRQEAYEKSAAFKKGQRFRAGIEGRISVLFRGRGMKRCRAQGRERFELWVGAAVLANNLRRIAALLTASFRQRSAA